jgi:hypothetical protein
MKRLICFLVWRLVRAYAATRPCVTIYLNGAPYLTRWFLTCRPESGKTGTPGWYLHHIHVSDVDRRPHNHPWEWARSWILRGWYLEERGLSAFRVAWHTGDRNTLHGDSVHRIAAVSRGGVWTLFHSGPKHGRGWGPVS